MKLNEAKKQAMKMGQSVYHDKFGNGTVISANIEQYVDSDYDVIYEIEFSDKIRTFAESSCHDYLR